MVAKEVHISYRKQSPSQSVISEAPFLLVTRSFIATSTRFTTQKHNLLTCFYVSQRSLIIGSDNETDQRYPYIIEQ